MGLVFDRKLCHFGVVKTPKNQEKYDSLIGMKHPQMIISGGRFREIYYWDSFWIIKGLLVCDMHISARQTLENIMYSTKKFGHTVNENRIYYQHNDEFDI